MRHFSLSDLWTLWLLFVDILRKETRRKSSSLLSDWRTNQFAFTKGIELCKNCSKELEAAKGKITILQKEMESIKEVPFEVNND